jgi:hypothetical protein
VPRSRVPYPRCRQAHKLRRAQPLACVNDPANELLARPLCQLLDQGHQATVVKVSAAVLTRDLPIPILTAETESCLVEVARRECNSECGDKSVDIENSSQPSCDSVVTSGIAPDTKSDSQPCARHYNKTRDRYGAILDNLGCICKVLLSLNIESCCVIPSHASIRLKRSTTS